MSVAFTYELVGRGWASCSLEVGNQRVTLTASYLSDALGELLAAIIAMVRGASRTTASLAEEPGEHVWVFESPTKGRVRIRIFEFRDRWRGRTSETGGHLVFDADCRLRALLPAMMRAVDRLHEKWGDAGYLAEWGNFSFPTEARSELRTLLEQRPWAQLNDSD